MIRLLFLWVLHKKLGELWFSVRTRNEGVVIILQYLKLYLSTVEFLGTSVVVLNPS